MTFAIKALRKVDAITYELFIALAKIRAKLRECLRAKVQELLDVEYELQRKARAEPFELREKLHKERTELFEYYMAECDRLDEAVKDIDSDASKAERAEREAAIEKRIQELYKLW